MRPSRLINVAAIQTHDVPRVGILTPERSVTAVPQGLFGGATCVPRFSASKKDPISPLSRPHDTELCCLEPREIRRIHGLTDWKGDPLFLAALV